MNKPSFFIVKILLLPLLLGFSVPAIAHNEFNGGCASHCEDINRENTISQEARILLPGKGGETE